MTPQTARQTARPLPLLLGLAALFAALSLVLLLPGRMVVNVMEGDVLHLLDGVVRMRMGQAPHLDFATPLGVLAYLPISVWDAEFGRALALSHAAAAAACLPGLVWIGLTRLRLPAALGFGAVVMLTAATLSWSPDAPGATTAMSYNRWSWALIALGMAMMLLDRRGVEGAPAPRRGALIDGLLIGLIGATLLFLKATFAAAFAGLWLVWVLTGAERRAALAAVACGIGFALVFGALAGGVEAGQAYLGDLLRVANAGELRALSQKTPLVAFATPAGLVMTLAALVATMALARGGQARRALRFFAAVVMVHLLAWQNFGFDPTGMTPLALILPALAGRVAPGAVAFGRPAASVAFCAGLVILGVRAPGLVNSALSFRHLFAEPTDQVSVMTDFAPDLVWQRSEDDFAGRFKLMAEDDEPISLGGVTYPECRAATGGTGLAAEAATAILEAPDLRARSVLVLDLVNPLWMLTGAPPQRGAWNWVYGSAAAQVAEVELVALPRCAYSPPIMRRLVEDVARSGRAARVALVTSNWTIFELGAPGSAPVPEPEPEADPDAQPQAREAPSTASGG